METEMSSVRRAMAPWVLALVTLMGGVAGCPAGGVSGRLEISEDEGAGKIMVRFVTEEEAPIPADIFLKFQVEGAELVFPDGPGTSACLALPQSGKLELAAVPEVLPVGASISVFAYQYVAPDPAESEESGQALRLAQEQTEVNFCSGALVANATYVKLDGADTADAGTSTVTDTSTTGD